MTRLCTGLVCAVLLGFPGSLDASAAPKGPPVHARAITPLVKRSLRVQVSRIDQTLRPTGYLVTLYCRGEALDSSYREADDLNPVEFRFLEECLWTVTVALLGPGGKPTHYAQPFMVRVGAPRDEEEGEDGSR